MKPIGLILTDTHLKEDNIELVTDIWVQAINKCQELYINNIYFIGDFFTARKAQSLIVDEAGRNIINKIIKAEINLIIIPGNHDKVDLDSQSSYLDEYTGKNFITIFKDTDCRIVNDTYNLCLHFIPYFKETGSYPEKLNKAISILKKYNDQFPKQNNKHILLTHIAVNGVRNNDGSVIENNLRGTQFSFFDKVFVGHYHNQSFIEPNIYYIGSAYQANFGEDENKGFTILNDDGSHEFIQSNFPKYIKVKLSPKDEKGIKAAEKEYRDSKDNVRFIFEGEKSELKNVNKEKLSALGIDVKFNEDSAVPLDNNGLLEKASSVSFDRSNINEAFKTFCEMKHIEDNTVGLDYLNQI